MRKGIIRIKGMGSLVWHTKHELMHVLWGLAWLWIVEGVWKQVNGEWFVAAVFGSIFPDLEHIVYFVTYGKKDPYSKVVITLFKKRQWKVLMTFFENNHKNNTNLMFHNYYTIAVLVGIGIFCYADNWRIGVVFVGAMLTHFLFDIADDLLYLGKVNPNWKRLGRGRKQAYQEVQNPTG